MTGLTSSQSLNQETSETMMNNNYNQNNNITNNAFTKNSDYDFGPLSVESYDQALFSPTMATNKTFTSSTNSPQTLNSAEESFIFETSDGGHILFKYSQDYENLDFEMETNQISETCELPNEHKSKLLYSEPAIDKLLFSNNVLMYDSMINGNNIVACNDDESCLEFTVQNFGDVIIKDEPHQQQQQQQQVTNFTEIYETINTNRTTDCEGQNRFITNLLTPAPSPKTTDKQCLNVNDRTTNDRSWTAAAKTEKLVIDDDRLHFEHNYYNNNNNNYKGNTANSQSCKRKLNMDDMEIPQSKQLKRVPPLKIKIPTKEIMDDIDGDILVDGLDYVEELTISSPLLKEFLKGIDETINGPEFEKNISVVEKMEGSDAAVLSDENSTDTTETCKPSTSYSSTSHNTSLRKRSKRRSSYECPNSVLSVASTIFSADEDGQVFSPSTPSSSSASTSTTPAAAASKKRGRPRKTTTAPLSPSQYKHLSEEDFKYIQMREKNNEASRRSRVHRKDRELQLEEEGQQLVAEHVELVKKEVSLSRQIEKWRAAVLRYAQA